MERETESHISEEHLRARARGQAILLEITRTLASSLDAQVILQAAVDGVVTLVGFDTAAVYMLQDDTLYLSATTPPLPPGFPEVLRTAPLGDHPHIGQAIRSQSPLLVEDFLTEPLTEAEREVAAQRHFRTILYVPMVADGRSQGIFMVGSVARIILPHQAEVELAGTLAGLTAITLDNARLYQEGQQRAQELALALEQQARAEEQSQQLQAQLHQAQKMESIGRLAGGVAHDFNNYLTIILGQAEFLLQEPGLPLAWHDDLQRILDAAERSSDLTRQLLAFARRQTARPRELDLNHTVSAMTKLLRRLMGEDIELLWLPCPQPALVHMDPAQVDQVLANLCVNARHAIDGVGRITLRTELVHVDADSSEAHPDLRPGPYVQLSVSDTGCGMDEATQEHVFEPFFTTRPEGEGTGLGLATVYGIVKQNQGFIHLISQPGQGTTFEILLPRCACAVDEAQPTCAEDARLASAQITLLLVEDSVPVLELERRMLTSLGYQVLTAKRPSEALELARAHGDAVRVLLTDVVLPEMNGQELARRVAELCPEVRTVYVSGYAPQLLADRGVLHQDLLLVPKPFTKTQLGQAVQEALSGSGTA